MPEDEKHEYIRCAYCVALCGWKLANERYRDFFVNLVQNDRQTFLDFLRRETVFAHLSCPLTNVSLFIKWMNLWKESQINYKVSTPQLSFCLLLAFDIGLSVNTMRNYIASCRMDTDELVDLLKYVRMANIDDC